MKRSRIICSIIAIIFVVISISLLLMCVKSNMQVESNIEVYLKAIYVAAFGISMLVYVWVKKRLANKMLNKNLGLVISRIYYYVYLGIIVFLSRSIMAAVTHNTDAQVLRAFSNGLGSYINYGIGMAINNQMYANVIVNSILALISCILIKKIMLNITQNDTVSTFASMMYIFIPQSLAYVTEYIRYNYNTLLVLAGIYLFITIIDEVKNFGKKSYKYLIYAGILGIIQSLDIVFGGSYILWLCLLLVVTLAEMYVDTTHIHIKFKDKLNFKFKRLAEKVERLNISKLIYVSVICLLMSGITTLIYTCIASTSNYIGFDASNSVNILMHSRSYYIVLVIFTLVFEIIGIILKRKLDIKMLAVKISFIVSYILTFFMKDSVYASALFDMLLTGIVVINVCNICYNREERVKLLKDKN